MTKNRTRSAALILAVIFGIGIVTVACGQKGPLYLPDEDQQEQRKKEEK